MDADNKISILKASDYIVESEQIPGVVVFSNYEELKAKLITELEYYKGFEYSLDNYDVAVINRDMLKRVKQALENKKRQIERVYNAPYLDVESKLTELIDLIKEPFKVVDNFIKDNEKLAKQQKIMTYSEAVIDSLGLSEYSERIVKSPAFFNPKWLNKSCSASTWRAEVKAKLNDAANDITQIMSSEEKYSAALLAHYFETLSLKRAGEFISTLIGAERNSKAFDSERFAADEGLDAAMPEEEFELTNEYIIRALESGINPFTDKAIFGMDEKLLAWIKGLI